MFLKGANNLFDNYTKSLTELFMRKCFAVVFDFYQAAWRIRQTIDGNSRQWNLVSFVLCKLYFYVQLSTPMQSNLRNDDYIRWVVEKPKSKKTTWSCRQWTGIIFDFNYTSGNYLVILQDLPFKAHWIFKVYTLKILNILKIRHTKNCPCRDCWNCLHVAGLHAC